MCYAFSALILVGSLCRYLLSSDLTGQIFCQGAHAVGKSGQKTFHSFHRFLVDHFGGKFIAQLLLKILNSTLFWRTTKQFKTWLIHENGKSYGSLIVNQRLLDAGNWPHLLPRSLT
jgi:hypothetical protein